LLFLEIYKYKNKFFKYIDIYKRKLNKIVTISCNNLLGVHYTNL